MTRDRVAGSAGELFARLQRETRPRRWFATAVLSAAAGVFGGLVLDWPFALITAIGVAGVLLVWDRTHGNLAGWGSAHDRPHRIAAVAARLETRGWTFRPVPGPAGPYRCLLIGRQGAFIVQHGAAAAHQVRALRVVADAVEAAFVCVAGISVAVQLVLVVENTTSVRPGVVGDVIIVPAADLSAWLCRRDIVLSRETVADLAAAAQRLVDAEPDR